MQDHRAENLADILVNYSVQVRPGDWVLLGGNVVALPLIHAAARHALRAGGNVSVMLESDELEEIALVESSQEQLQWLSPAETLLMEQVDAIVYVGATANTRALSGADLEKQRVQQLTQGKLHQIRRRRAAAGELRWVYTEFPCAAFAQDADMSLADYEDFVYAATYADQPAGAARCRELFRGHEQVVLRGPNVALRFSIAGRTFLNSAGRHNAPDGEIYTGPVEDSVNGWIRFTYPAIYGGREVNGVEMTFEDGRVVQARASKNQDFLLKMLDTDAGARYLGEFGIGTNYQIQHFTRRILYDEKIGGTIHLAVGSSYPESGGRNESGLHWDFICDMRDEGEIWVDGERVYQNGAFLE
jgi:aminopeptidase